MGQNESDKKTPKTAVLGSSRPAPGTLLLRFSGDWHSSGQLVSFEEARAPLSSPPALSQVNFDVGELGEWDSVLAVFLMKILQVCSRSGIAVDLSSLPAGVRKLLELAAPENQRTGVPRGKARRGFLQRIADAALSDTKGIAAVLSFLGEATVAFFRLLRGKAKFRRSDLVTSIRDAGAQALPIVSLISFLVGMILAFVAAIQLKVFGAQILVADVVGIGMVRVMGAVMTGVIMAGRTGAAFAAQLGTMQVNEEIDALETLGFAPVEFLVLPRMLSLMLMMPLLCIYADLMGMLGGMLVGVGVLHIGFVEYYQQSKNALDLTHFWIGIFQSFVFGILVAVSGCLRGMQCERSASAVGYAATSAVVTGIVSIVVATLVVTFACQVLGI
jgi:phospholipid/cholesterol/gamma-HCH transport system permease protein